MVRNMKTELTRKIPNSFVAYPALIALMIYVFGYQFAYPFSSTLFLYIAFGFTVVWMVFNQGIYFSAQMLIMALVAVVSALGVFYTQSPKEGNREAILTIVVWILLIAFAQNAAMLEKIKKAIYICSFAVLLGVLLQYLFAGAVNTVLSRILRSDSYERLIWSYDVDGAYAGFSAYTPDAAYFCAALFGFTMFGRLQAKELSFKKKIACWVVILLSVFAVILTSKRGVAIALIVSFVLTYMIWKKFSAKTIFSTIGLLAVCVILIGIFSEQNEVIQMFLQRFDPTDGDITTGRSEIWKSALDKLTNGFIGMGTGSAYVVYDTGLHNIYLQLFYDHGLVGVIIYLLFFISNLVYAIKRREAVAIYIQLLMLVYGMSGNPIYSNSFFIVYTIFSVVSVGEQEQNATELS